MTPGESKLSVFLERLDEWVPQVDKRLKALEEAVGSVQAEQGAVADVVAGSIADAERDYQRKTFIRDAATRIYVQGMTVPESGSVVTFSPNTCWKAAVALWDAKPEDC